MKTIAPGEIAAAADRYLRSETEEQPARRRERSWDLCFSHFQKHPKPTEAMETSCLHLGYYLASWGMLRGSSFLFQKTNLLHYQRAIDVIEQHNQYLRGWDVPDYLASGKYVQFSSAWTDLRAALLPDGGRDLTLVSKVMMGVWGCIPSFDTFFVRTFQDLSTTRSERGSWNSAGADALRMLHSVYDLHADEIDGVRKRFPVWEFTAGGPAGQLMTRAKVLDIYGFYQSWKRPNNSPGPLIEFAASGDRGHTGR